MQTGYIFPKINVAGYSGIESPRKKKEYRNKEYFGDGLTDKEVLEIRWLHKYREYSIKSLMEISGKSYSYIYAIISYRNRCKLIPNADTFLWP